MKTFLFGFTTYLTIVAFIFANSADTIAKADNAFAKTEDLSTMKTINPSQSSLTEYSESNFQVYLKSESPTFSTENLSEIKFGIKNMSYETNKLKFVSIYLSKLKYEETKSSRKTELFVSYYSVLGKDSPNTPLSLDPEETKEFCVNIQSLKWEDSLSANFDLRNFNTLPKGNYYLFVVISVPDAEKSKDKLPIFQNFVSNQVSVKIN